jgi:alpha-ketoglutarate-dependent taurine dioxygenase
MHTKPSRIQGHGIVFGQDVDDTTWAAILADPAHAHFVLQPLVDQHVHSILCRTGWQPMLVVGLLHCFNDHFLGPGIFRASSLEHPIVNVAGGNGIILSPVVFSCRWPLARRIVHPPDCPAELPAGHVKENLGTFKHLEACERARVVFDFPPHCVFDLRGENGPPTPIGTHTTAATATTAAAATATTAAAATGRTAAAAAQEFDIYARIFECVQRDGIALVHTDWTAEASGPAMVDFVSRIGILNPHLGHETDVWDIRPLKTAGGARSHTAEEFPMHTDCSFEDPPPRYMALYVVNEDQLGGGLSTLVDTEVLMRHLSPRAITTLHTTEFDIRVPPEFFKGTASIRGRILSASKLWRYRSDTIVRDTCTPAQLQALGELDALLENPHMILTTKLPSGAMLILDNSRWLHGRTAIYDPARWLKRIRFHPLDFSPDATSAFARTATRADSLSTTLLWRAKSISIAADDKEGSTPTGGLGSQDADGTPSLSRVSSLGDPPCTPVRVVTRFRFEALQESNEEAHALVAGTPIAVQIAAGQHAAPFEATFNEFDD